VPVPDEDVEVLRGQQERKEKNNKNSSQGTV